MDDLLPLIGLALIIVAWGAIGWLNDLGEARKTEAEARLLEAKARRTALTQGCGRDEDGGGRDAP